MTAQQRIHNQPRAGTAEYFRMRRAQKREDDSRLNLYDNFWNVVSGPEFVARGRELAAMMAEPLTPDPGNPADKFRR